MLLSCGVKNELELVTVLSGKFLQRGGPLDRRRDKQAQSKAAVITYTD